MQQKLQDQEDTYASYMKELEAKIEKNQREKRLQIQGLKTTLEEKVQHISNLFSLSYSLTRQQDTRLQGTALGQGTLARVIQKGRSG